MVNVDKNINQHNAGWSFENISEDFDDHIQRSIPYICRGMSWYACTAIFS
jgi:hypothetical protein